MHKINLIAFWCFAASLLFCSCKKDTPKTVQPVVIIKPDPVVTPKPVPVPVLNINPTLVNANPTFEANALYQFLKNNYGK